MKRTAALIKVLALAALAACTDAPAQDGPPADDGKADKRLQRFASPKALAEGAKVDEAPDFMGPRRDGVFDETKLLKDFPKAGLKPLWSFSTGAGYAAPAIKGRTLVFLHRLETQEQVVALDSEGSGLLWTFEYPTTYEDRYGFGDGPRATPVIDGDRVFTYSAQGVLHCLDLKTGEKRWRRALMEEFKVPQGFFGNAATPLLEGGKLIVNLGKPGPCVIALDPKDGKTLWKAGDQWGASYASPVAATVRGERRVLVFAGGDSKPPHGGLLSLDPKDGKIEVRVPWRSKTYESVNAALPAVADNCVFITASYETGGALVRIKRDFSGEVLWKTDKLAAHFNTPLIIDGHIYGFDGRNTRNAELVCLALDSGEEKWRQYIEWKETIGEGEAAREVDMSPGRATLIRADGKVLCLGEYGHLVWMELSPEGPKVLSRFRPFFAPESWTPPVISRGLLYICQNEPSKTEGRRLLCFDLRGD